MDVLLPAHIHYGKVPVKITFPDSWDVVISRFKGADTPALSDDEIIKQLASPIGADPISTGARNKKSAVIVVEDNTRPTNFELIALYVLEQLRYAGVPKENICFVGAVGMHRAMILPDFIRKLGPKIPHEYACFSHNPFNGCIKIGATSIGNSVEINANVLDAEYRITLGTYLPHGFAGFGGSYKLILPGVASYESIKYNHSHIFMNKIKGPGKLEGNAINKDIFEAAKLVGIDFSVGVIPNEAGDICRVFCGDIKEAYDQGCAVAVEHFQTDLIKNVDLVLENNFMKATEPNNAFNDIAISELREGGSLILSSNTPEGTCPHYLYGNFGLGEKNVGFKFKSSLEKYKNAKNIIAFSQYPDVGGSWYFGGAERITWARTWDRVLEIVGEDKKRVGIYPTADVSIVS